MECNPHFCSAISIQKQGVIHISVCPYWRVFNLAVAKPSSQDTKWDKKTIAIHGRGRNDNECFSLPIWIWERRGNVKFYLLLPLSTGHHKQRPGRADLGEISYPLPASASFPRMCLQSPGWGVSQQGSSLVTRNCQGRKNNFLLFVVSAWDPFFSRTLPKWVSLRKMVKSSPLRPP